MKVQNLGNIDLEEIVSIINLSFSDYIVPLQLNLEQLKSKIETENIKPELSKVVYDGDKIVGVMLHGLRKSDKGSIVYNAATGVAPAYRGKGLVNKMYHALLPQLEQLQVQKMVLEVIEGNHSAIRAYEKMGYTIDRKLDCFKGKLTVSNNNNNNTEVSLKEINTFQWNEFTSFWDVTPSWQNAVESLENSKNLCIVGAYINNRLVGYAIFNPVTKKVHQFAVAADYRRNGIGMLIFSYINEIADQQEVFVYNIDNSAVAAIAFLRKLGLSKPTSQFEMSRMV